MTHLSPLEIRNLIYSAARKTGFDLCGIAPVLVAPEHVAAWRNWTAEGRHGQMAYMTRQQRSNLSELAPWVKSVICLGLNYWLPEPQRGVPSDVISIYAQGKDYHEVMKGMMERLLDELWKQIPVSFEAKLYVDTGPILERAYAEAAGMGWIGKNTCLINEQRGSWFFLGEILTSLELPAETPRPDRCGTCTACLDACPTGAFIAPYQIDARKCISYQTIELHGEIPEADRPGVGGHVFGCDICQEVCPWNSRATSTDVPDFLPLEILSQQSPDFLLEEMAHLSVQDFRHHFRTSPIKRSKYQGFLRNVAISLGNAGAESSLPALQLLAVSDDPIVREHAIWAIQKIAHRTNPINNLDSPAKNAV